MAEYSWVPLALLGALVYGGFSFLLSFIDPKIKANESAQVGYGLLLAVVQVPLNIIMFYLWSMKNKDSVSKVLWKNVNWKIALITVIAGFLITPVHTIVINAGGAVAQQTMYSLAIVPVIIGSWVFFKQGLTKRQWLGLILAGLGSWLMGDKSKKD
jgi:drug/metabolite transporter (DMT)-like permease